MGAASSFTARAYWATGPGTGELRQVAVSPPGPGEVLVRALYGGISRGSEALVALGRVPASQRQAMRAPFQEGEFPFPVKYGYSNVGIVLGGERDLIGRTVFCLFPHQTTYVVPRTAVVPLPAGLPPERAVLAANLETALNAVWDAAALPGERIVVIGGGAVGCLIARLVARIPGTEVTLVDTDPSRAALADGAEVAFRAPEETHTEADLVFHASGRPQGLQTAMRIAAFEGRVVEVSWYGDKEVPVPLGERFHSGRLRLISSQVGHVAPAMRARWSRERRLAKALELLKDPLFDRIISGESSFASLPETLPRLATEPGGALCQRIVYPAA